MDVAITGLSALIQYVNNYQHKIRQRFKNHVEKRYTIKYIMLMGFFSDFN